MNLHLKSLIEQSVCKKYPSGSTIFYQGEVPRSAAILVSGVVRVLSISNQGDEQIVTFHIEGEFFPASWIFDKTPSTLFFYEAVTDCEVAFAPKNELLEYMNAKPERSKALLDYFTTNYAASMIRINALEQPKASDKLAYTLYFLCQRYGDLSGNKVTIPIALTHQTLASLVGLTRETTAIEMNTLKKARVISYQKQMYTVDVEKLVNILGEDSFRNISIPG